MGKETKIGLAVIGVLLSVFGVLLFRHFLASHSPPAGTEQAQVPIEVLSSAGMSKPSVVVASKDSAGISSKMWDEPRPTVIEPVGKAPPASYMPATERPSGEAPADPYAAGNGASQPAFEMEDESGAAAAQAEGEPDAAVSSPRTSPFQSSANEPGQVSEDQALELPQTAAENHNPLRKLSAEMPLDDAQESAAATPEMELPTADTYAEPEPAARRDPFEATGTESEPAPANDPLATAEVGDTADEAIADPQAAVDTTTLPDSQFNELPATNAPAPERSDPFDRFEVEPGRPKPSQDWQASPDAASPTAEPAVVTPAAEQPLPVENGLYTVQPGDTLWSISEKVYGTGGYFKALAARNRSMLPRSDKLTVGSQVAVPPTSDLEHDFPTLCPRQRKSALVRPQAIPPAATQRRANSDVYIVAEGDTLFDIARYELGKASRWAEIYELNRDLLGQDFDYLRPGTELVMPPQAETATRPAASRY